jgi:hypothetical protein
VTAGAWSVNVEEKFLLRPVASGRAGHAEVYMDETSDRFLELLHGLEDVANSVTAEQAHSGWDETTLQVFWKKWPELSAWAGALWGMLSAELAGPSSPHRDPDLDEVGGSD